MEMESTRAQNSTALNFPNESGAVRVAAGIKEHPQVRFLFSGGSRMKIKRGIKRPRRPERDGEARTLNGLDTDKGDEKILHGRR